MLVCRLVFKTSVTCNASGGFDSHTFPPLGSNTRNVARFVGTFEVECQRLGQGGARRAMGPESEGHRGHLGRCRHGHQPSLHRQPRSDHVRARPRSGATRRRTWTTTRVTTDWSAILTVIAHSLVRAVQASTQGRIEASNQSPSQHPGCTNTAVLFLQHMVWHDGWHVGLIFLALRLNGQEPPEEWEEPNVWGQWRTETW